MMINSSYVLRKFPPLATGLIILLIISSMLLIYLASSVQFSCSVVSNSLRPHWLQHARPPCPSPTPRVYSKLMSIESVMPSNHLILCRPLLPPSIFPASRSFQMSQFFTSGGQSIGVSASASVLPMNNQDWFPLGWTGWSPCSPRDSWKSSPTLQFKSINSSALSLLFCPTLTSIHDYWKSHSLD